MTRSIRHLLAMMSLCALAITAVAQPKISFTRADTLRGMLRPERTCYDVKQYNLDLTVSYEEKKIFGKNEIIFETTDTASTIQIDLFENMEITEIFADGMPAKFRREHNAVFVDLPKAIPPRGMVGLTVEYGGIPIVAKRPPWDGGFVWTTDDNEKPWVGVACEGIGASLWWPMKDHLSDEPDSMTFTIRLPKGELHDLMAVANGQLRKEYYDEDSNHVFKWAVTYPINSYNVTLNIADYVHIHDTFINASGTHDLDYYVLRKNEEAARQHFKQVAPMMRCFEKFFGEYPFWNDGYALVETDYWGMEHQGAVAYGNNYKNNSWGFDYIIIHETGHEWWGNHVSCDDHAELWIHESFCTYSETVYMECMYGKEKALSYIGSQQGGILNRKPIVGPRDVNYEGWGDSDMYYKGAWMLHTLRNVIRDDSIWFSTLRTIQDNYGMKTTDTKSIIEHFQLSTGRDLSKIFEQYLYHPHPPKLEYDVRQKGKVVRMKYRWKADVEGFEMNIGVIPDEKGGYVMLDATTDWQSIEFPGKADEVKIDVHNFYIWKKKL